MRRQKIEKIVSVKINKLVHGGQGIGILDNGKKCFVWGALPEELVTARVIKNKKDWCEAIAIEVLEPSPDRVEPLESEIYLATSPWQIIDYKKEAYYKQQILAECFEREDIDVDWQEFSQSDQEFNYRNKMEYNFWFHNDTKLVDLALHNRGSRQKVALKGSALASDAINKAGKQLIEFINLQKIEARDLKSVIIRSSLDGQVGLSLFVVNKELVQKFSSFENNFACFEILLANPKSPASVSVKTLYKSKREYLVDKLLGNEYIYSTRSFFQVNIPVYEKVLAEIANIVQSSNAKNIIDMYSGVGSIGLSVVGDKQNLTMIETSEESTKQAKLNIGDRKNCEVVTATAESVLEYLQGDEVVILDPPRAGLHKNVTSQLLDKKPPQIIYLSCNPSTQARDIKLLTDGGYKIKSAKGYNFFPRTPHIESLIILDAVE